ncbi:hypothetical protein [Novosphingobium lindaniclasticum]
MAQFQILFSPSEAEWRAITTEFCFAPVDDQQSCWPSFEEAEAVRKRLLGRYPGASLRIAIESPEVGEFDWQTREKLRFTDGTYSETPWHDEPWYQASHEEHFCHLSTEQPGKIAFTENAAKGRLDRQLVMSPGRYLHRYFSGTLDNNAIETWCARLSVLLEEHALKITQDADEIEDVYVGGPASCMAHPEEDFEGCCHPVRVYAGPDTAIAYIGPRDDARARSVVWPARKIYTTIYGDVSRLKLLLEANGYSEGALDGARIQRIEDDEYFVVPYIDTEDGLGDDGEFLVIGRGAIPSGNTTGISRVPWYCPRCDNSARPYEEVWFGDGSCEEWCYDCFHNCTQFCDHNERTYSDQEAFITVFGDGTSCSILEMEAENFEAVYIDDRGEWWTASCCRKCDASGEIFHGEDLTEYHGEWLSCDYLPEPLDDDDADALNAHVLAYHGFVRVMGGQGRDVASAEVAATLAAARLSDLAGCRAGFPAPIPLEIAGQAPAAAADSPQTGA